MSDIPPPSPLLESKLDGSKEGLPEKPSHEPGNPVSAPFRRRQRCKFRFRKSDLFRSGPEVKASKQLVNVVVIEADRYFQPKPDPAFYDRQAEPAEFTRAWQDVLVSRRVEDDEDGSGSGSEAVANFIFEGTCINFVNIETRINQQLVPASKNREDSKVRSAFQRTGDHEVTFSWGGITINFQAPYSLMSTKDVLVSVRDVIESDVWKDSRSFNKFMTQVWLARKKLVFMRRKNEAKIIGDVEKKTNGVRKDFEDKDAILGALEKELEKEDVKKKKRNIEPKRARKSTPDEEKKKKKKKVSEVKPPKEESDEAKRKRKDEEDKLNELKLAEMRRKKEERAELKRLQEVRLAEARKKKKEEEEAKRLAEQRLAENRKRLQMELDEKNRLQNLEIEESRRKRIENTKRLIEEEKMRTKMREEAKEKEKARRLDLEMEEFQEERRQMQKEAISGKSGDAKDVGDVAESPDTEEIFPQLANSPLISVTFEPSDDSNEAGDVAESAGAQTVLCLSGESKKLEKTPPHSPDPKVIQGNDSKDDDNDVEMEEEKENASRSPTPDSEQNDDDDDEDKDVIDIHADYEDLF